MPYIYKITNKSNEKSYIGMTLRTIQKRWSEHLEDSKKETKQHRPLYSAIKKYGEENFIIEEIEECFDEKIIAEREKYWIEYFGTFKNGYNATIGGDGKPYIDYDLVVLNYNELKSCKKVAELMNILPDTVSAILKVRNVSKVSKSENQKDYKKSVKMFSLNNEFINSFESLKAASNYLIENKLTNCKVTTGAYHISEVCNKKRKTFAKFIWRFAE